MADVSADIQKFVGGDRLEKPFGPRATEPRPHSHQGERDDADEYLPVAEIELEAGRQFDPEVVEAFSAIERDLRGIYHDLAAA